MKKRWLSLMAVLLVFAMLATSALAEFGDVSDDFEPEVEEVEEFLLGGEEQEEFDLALEQQEYEEPSEDPDIVWFEEDAIESITSDAAMGVVQTTGNYTEYTNDTSFVVNGKTIKAEDVGNQNNCWSYASAIYNKIWGTGFSSSFNDSNNMLRNLPDSSRILTVENLKSFVGAASLGSTIRITSCTSSCSKWGSDNLECGHTGHSLIIVAKDSNGFTVLDNHRADGKVYSVKTRYYTWQGFVNYWRSYPYIKYIKWPGGTEYKDESYNKIPGQPVLSVAPADNLHSTRISWGATQYTTYYDIHIRDANGNVVLDDSTNLDTSYTTQLSAGVYYAYVGAVNTNANEWKSNDSAHTWFAVSEYNAVPAKVSLRVTAADNQHDTTFSWDRVSNADHYDVHVYDANNKAVVDLSVGVGTQYKVTLKAGTYTAYIGAVNAYADEWKWSNSDKVSFTVKNSYPYPDKPVLTVKATNDNSDVEFSWNTTQNTTYYDLHICNEAGTLIANHSVGKATSYKKRMAAGTYWAYVGAVNADVPDWTTKDSDKVKFVVAAYNSPHTHTIVEDKAVAATCITPGKTAGSHCSTCGAVIQAQTTIPATGHKAVTVKGKAATCTATGLTDGSKCSVCGVTLKAQQTIAKKAHTPVTVKGYAATYDRAGLTDGVKCSVCGTWIMPQRAIAKLEYPTRVLDRNKNNGTVTVNVGDRIRLVPQFATSTGASVTSYKSGKVKFATVDGGGLVTAVAEGKAKITVTTNNKKTKATITVMVVDPYKPTGISIKQGKTVTLTMGQTLQLGAQLAPASARATLTWKSSKPKVVTVDGSGRLVPVGEGKAKITVTTHNKKKATITVQVVDPYKPLGISINQGKTVTLKVGQTFKLGTTLNPTSAQTALTWKSAKPTIATVDGSGLVRAVKKGKAKITVTTYNKKKATITVVVVE